MTLITQQPETTKITKITRVPRGIPLELWNQRQMVEQGGRRYSKVPVTCPTCNRQRLLRTADARQAIETNQSCKSCHCHTIGKLGYQAMRRNHSHLDWLKMIAKSQREKAKPSGSELKAIEVFEEILPDGYQAEWQVIAYDKYIVDFIITSNEGDNWVCLVEIVGYWHRNNQKQCARDVELQMTSLIPVVMIDAELLDTDDGQTEFAKLIHEQLTHHQNILLNMEVISDDNIY